MAWCRSAANRVIALGDLHGDFSAAKTVLRAAGVVGTDGRWTGGATVLVQTGDILDRGDEEQAIIDWFEDLEVQAHAAGGAFVWLLGNHELMNAAGDFRYVTAGGVADFADAPEGSREATMAPGGTYARRFGGQNVVVKVGDVVFAHAGVTPRWASHVGEINAATRSWLLAAEPGAAPAAVAAEDGPVWTRAYGGAVVDCVALRRALDVLGAARMVVGHTVQLHGITSACDGALWRIDVGMAAAYGGQPAALELVTGKPPRVILAARP